MNLLITLELSNCKKLRLIKIMVSYLNYSLGQELCNHKYLNMKCIIFIDLDCKIRLVTELQTGDKVGTKGLTPWPSVVCWPGYKRFIMCHTSHTSDTTLLSITSSYHRVSQYWVYYRCQSTQYY